MEEFNFIIIDSSFGGSVNACMLAQKTASIANVRNNIHGYSGPFICDANKNLSLSITSLLNNISNNSEIKFSN